MKKYLLIPLLLFLIVLSANAQEFWSPTGNLSGNDFVPAIECDSIGTLVAYSHNVGIFRSTNDGDQWSLTGITNQRVSTIKASHDGKIFAICNTTSGVYIQLSTDEGLTWNIVYSSSRPNNYFSGSGMAFINSSTIVAVISFTLGPTIGDIGVEIVRSTNGGFNWQLLNVSTGWGGAEDLARLADGRIIVTTDLSGLSYSSDNGSSWNILSSFPPVFTNFIKTDSQGNIFVGTSTAASFTNLLFRSTDNGVSWQGAGLLGGQDGGEIEALYTDYQDRVYASVVTFNPDVSTVYRSPDAGNTWEELNSGLPVSEVVYSLTGNQQDIIFAGTGSSGVYKGSDITPINLESFTAMNNGNDIILKWRTATETNNSGFEVQRLLLNIDSLYREDDEPGEDWMNIDFVKGNGTISKPQDYLFQDKNLRGESYRYRLKQINFDGSFEYSKTITVKVDAPLEFVLYQNYPNPFNPTTTLRYSIPKQSFVSLKVYDILGKEIQTLVNEEKPAGVYELNWKAANLPSGIYIYKLKTGNFISLKKMVLLK